VHIYAMAKPNNSGTSFFATICINHRTLVQLFIDSYHVHPSETISVSQITILMESTAYHMQLCMLSCLLM